MRINIKKYINKIRNFNPFNYFLKKRIQSLEISKSIQKEIIITFKMRIKIKNDEIKNLEKKIFNADQLISEIKESLTNLKMIGGN
ncbi:hypothetical protein LCGC14_1419560 [marine sediment metagenome]|uniref:Uncharacterized protein n=1 Tax=marine sediment metagenome TaxID=412755 RepID=A0A0F9KD02_9ZZZZ